MKTFTTIAMTGVALGLVACAAPTSSNVTVKSSSAAATIKPGASVSLEKTFSKNMQSTGYNTVGLAFSEGYDAGNLSARLVPSEGLSVYGGATSRDFDMGTASTHTWDVDVSASQDGIYFLNVFVEAEGQPRSFSVQLNIGDVTDDMRKSAMPENGEMQDGLRVMDATETIK